MKKFWEMKQALNNEAEVYIYGEITNYKWDEEDTTAASFQKDLKELGNVSKINLHVNSPGGSVFEGIAIGNMLKSHKAKVTAHVDALAASIASVIVASCDEVIMPENSMLMIHNPWSFTVGNASELRKKADDLDKIAESSILAYLSKAGDKLTEERIKQIMDEETWLSAKEAFDLGLADEVTGTNQIAASVSKEVFNAYQNIPKELTQFVEKKTRMTKDELERFKEKTKNEIAAINAEVGGLYENIS